MKIKKFVVISFITILIAILSVAILKIFLGNFSNKKNDTIVLKLSEVHSDDFPTALAIKEFANLVEKRTDGHIKIEVFTDGRLYESETTAIEALQNGDLDFARVSCAPLSSYIPKMSLIQLPYLYRDREHQFKVLNGYIGKFFLDVIKKDDIGIEGLCFYDSGARSFYFKKEVHSVSDLEGMKIRIQTTPTMQRLCKNYGATGVIGIPTNDVYNKLLYGFVDGAENNIPTYQNMGDYQAAQYYVRTNHVRVPDILLASTSTLSKLKSEYVEIIKKCAKETEPYQVKLWAEKEAESELIIRKVKNKIIDLSDEELESFKKKAQPIYDEYYKEYSKVLDLIKNTK